MSNPRVLGSFLPFVLTAGCAQVLGIEDTEVDPMFSADKPKKPPANTADSGDATGGSADAGPGVPKEDAGPPEPGTDFRCLGSDWLTPSEESSIDIIATIVDIATQAPVEGMTVTECKTRLELDCSGEIVKSDESGVARLTVRKGFNGYLKLEGPDAAGDERVGYLWYFTQPLTNTYAFPILSMKRDFRDGFFYDGIERDAERGEIAVQVTDCTEDTGVTDLGGDEILNAPGVAAADIRLEISNDRFFDDVSREFYFSDGLPVSPPTAKATDVSGLGGFLNVVAGRVPVQAFRADSDKLVGKDTLLVSADFLTTVRLLPE